MIRSFIVNLRDHRNKRRNIERQRRFARNGIPGREPERAERFGHAAGIHEVQLGRQAYRSEHFGRQSRRVDRNRKALNSTGSRYRHLDPGGVLACAGPMSPPATAMVGAAVR